MIKLREDTQPFSLGNFDGSYFIHLFNPEKDQKHTRNVPKEKKTLVFTCLCRKRRQKAKTTEKEQKLNKEREDKFTIKTETVKTGKVKRKSIKLMVKSKKKYRGQIIGPG